MTLVRLHSEPYSYTLYSGLDQPARLLIRTQTEWETTWASIWRHHSERPPLPAVDFAREMVIVAALGTRPTGGHNILIESASETVAGVNLVIRSTAPGAGCGVTLALTQPVDIARVSRREGRVTYSERHETGCAP